MLNTSLSPSETGGLRAQQLREALWSIASLACELVKTGHASFAACVIGPPIQHMACRRCHQSLFSIEKHLTSFEMEHAISQHYSSAPSPSTCYPQSSPQLAHFDAGKERAWVHGRSSVGGTYHKRLI